MPCERFCYPPCWSCWLLPKCKHSIPVSVVDMATATVCLSFPSHRSPASTPAVRISVAHSLAGRDGLTHRVRISVAHSIRIVRMLRRLLIAATGTTRTSGTAATTTTGIMADVRDAELFTAPGKSSATEPLVAMPRPKNCHAPAVQVSTQPSGFFHALFICYSCAVGILAMHCVRGSSGGEVESRPTQQRRNKSV
jgi:hypothetical protein